MRRRDVRNLRRCRRTVLPDRNAVRWFERVFGRNVHAVWNLGHAVLHWIDVRERQRVQHGDGSLHAVRRCNATVLWQHMRVRHDLQREQRVPVVRNVRAAVLCRVHVRVGHHVQRVVDAVRAVRR